MKNINKSKIITGANGYIGSELSKFFKYKNFKVINFDKVKSKNVFNLDLKKRKDVNLFFKRKNISVVYHFGTHSALAYRDNFDKSFQEDYLSIFNLISALKQKKSNIKLVYLSSSYVYSGLKLRVAREDSYLKPKHNFGIGKKFFEDYLLKFYPNTVIFRLSSVFGHGKVLHPNTICNLVNECKEKNTVTIWGKGLRKMQYIYMSDVIKYLSIANRINPGIYNLVGNEYLNLYSVGKKISKFFSSKIELKKNKKEAETLCFISNNKLKNAVGDFFKPFTKSLDSYLKSFN